METLTTLCLASRPPALPGTFWSAWSLAPAVALPLAAALILVVRSASARERASFLTGWLLLALALVSPVCRLAATTASGHMVQHVILVALAPPLLVLGLPAGRWQRHLPGPLAASLLYAAAIWLSHAPRIYEAALVQPGFHLVLLALLLVAGIAFWSTLLAAPTAGHAALMAFAAMGHTTLLGALLALSPEPWYPLFAGRVESWGITALEDQQLAGLIMWVPMAGVYLLAALLGLSRLLVPSHADAQR
jgi:putative membrane protein